MIEIAHMFAGLAFGALLLKFKPDLIHNVLKNDIAFLIGSGIWGMIPDIGWAFRSLKPLSTWFHTAVSGKLAGYVFWGHTFLDKYPDTPIVASVVIGASLIVLFVYWRGLI